MIPPLFSFALSLLGLLFHIMEIALLIISLMNIKFLTLLRAWSHIWDMSFVQYCGVVLLGWMDIGMPLDTTARSQCSLPSIGAFHIKLFNTNVIYMLFVSPPSYMKRGWESSLLCVLVHQPQQCWVFWVILLEGLLGNGTCVCILLILSYKPLTETETPTVDWFCFATSAVSPYYLKSASSQ